MTNELIEQVRELRKAERSGYSTEVELGKLRYEMADALLSQHAELTAAREEIARLREASEYAAQVLPDAMASLDGGRPKDSFNAISSVYGKAKKALGKTHAD